MTNPIYIGITGKPKPLIDLTKGRIQDVARFVDDKRAELLRNDPREMEVVTAVMVDLLNDIAEIIENGYVGE